MLYILSLHHRGPVRDVELDGGAAGSDGWRIVRCRQACRLDAPAERPGW